MVDAFNLMMSRGLELPTPTVVNVNNGALAITDQPGEKATSTSANAQFTLDFGAAVTASQAGALYTDFPANGTLTVTGSSTAAFTGGTTTDLITNQRLDADGLAPAASAGYRHLLSDIQAAPLTYRYWRFSFANVNACNIGRLWLGTQLQVEFNSDYGATSWGFDEPPEPEILDGGATVLQDLPASRAPVFEFACTWASEAEMEAGWTPMAPLAATGKPVLVVRNPVLGASNPYRHNGIYWGLLRLQPFSAAQFNMFECQGKIKAML